MYSRDKGLYLLISTLLGVHSESLFGKELMVVVKG